MESELLGVGAMNSPRYRPAGLLVSSSRSRIMFDGGPGAEPGGRIDAWLLTDDRAELIAQIRRLARAYDTEPAVGSYSARALRVDPCPVVHTSHPTCGYLISCGRRRVVWAPEFWQFPLWAAGADLMFADAAGWTRPIRFAHNVGGHAAVCDTARRARENGVRRLVFAHIGRPSIRAIDRGAVPEFGEWGVQGRIYRLR
ncbi:MBL fold metallo-hydrolase [Nocardia anaemiae]|uniref:MBL fold metallo-hydrolase n=1 Tax=Nocardia anaemiae TaxID=263910 RepID=UPI0007A55BF1|nr:MBL fold metallo-hydrolase [Nocardia anaemiae]